VEGHENLSLLNSFGRRAFGLVDNLLRDNDGVGRNGGPTKRAAATHLEREGLGLERDADGWQNTAAALSTRQQHVSSTSAARQQHVSSTSAARQ
jgi:hypothetical protein